MNDLPRLKPTPWRWVFALVAVLWALAMATGALATLYYVDKHVAVPVRCAS